MYDFACPVLEIQSFFFTTCSTIISVNRIKYFKIKKQITTDYIIEKILPFNNNSIKI